MGGLTVAPCRDGITVPLSSPLPHNGLSWSHLVQENILLIGSINLGANGTVHFCCPSIIRGRLAVIGCGGCRGTCNFKETRPGVMKVASLMTFIGDNAPKDKLNTLYFVFRMPGDIWGHCFGCSHRLQRQEVGA